MCIAVTFIFIMFSQSFQGHPSEGLSKPFLLTPERLSLAVQVVP